MIYFIKSGHFIRIGHTNGPATLMRKIPRLQYGSPSKLVLLGTRPGGLIDEIRLHEQYAALHYRGDWFKMDGDVLDLPEVQNHPQVMTVHYQDDDYLIVDRGSACQHRQSKGSWLVSQLNGFDIGPGLGHRDEWGRRFKFEPVDPIVRRMASAETSYDEWLIQVKLGETALGYLGYPL